MSHARPAGIGVLRCVCVLALSIPWAGCGLDLMRATLPVAAEGFTLSELEDIQDDGRLTDDEKRARVREALGVSDDESGNRLADFLLNVDVP